MCTLKEYECTKRIQRKSEGCLEHCDGLILTSFSKLDPDLEKIKKAMHLDQKKNFALLGPADILSYNKFTKWFEFPIDMKGMI